MNADTPARPALAAGRFRHADQIATIDAAAWDGLFGGGYPFTSHRFLKALETSGSVSPQLGWRPCHLLLEAADGRLLAACPLYLKAHSYGEFVFDFAWARAAEQLGQSYYPRLVNAIPFTPSTGPRWAAVNAEAEALLLQRLGELAAERGYSSTHVLFVDASGAGAAQQAGASLRHDIQYQWFNDDYLHFDDFLARLSSDKRKKIRRERRKLMECGITYQREAAHTLSAGALDEVFTLYASTYALRGQPPYLNRAFFDDYLREGPSPMWVLSGRAAGQEDQREMMALFFEGGDTLYGRHWGARRELDGAHFETCYYQGIDWCIERGLRRFDAGTQGDHKRSRGFDPVRTTSAHWLVEPRLRAAVDDFLARERAAVTDHAAWLHRAHSAYRQPAAAGGADG